MVGKNDVWAGWIIRLVFRPSLLCRTDLARPPYPQPAETHSSFRWFHLNKPENQSKGPASTTPSNQHQTKTKPFVVLRQQEILFIKINHNENGNETHCGLATRWWSISTNYSDFDCQPLQREVVFVVFVLLLVLLLKIRCAALGWPFLSVANQFKF